MPARAHIGRPVSALEDWSPGIPSGEASGWGKAGGGGGRKPGWAGSVTWDRRVVAPVLKPATPSTVGTITAVSGTTTARPRPPASPDPQGARPAGRAASSCGGPAPPRHAARAPPTPPLLGLTRPRPHRPPQESGGAGSARKPSASTFLTGGSLWYATWFWGTASVFLKGAESKYVSCVGLAIRCRFSAPPRRREGAAEGMNGRARAR